MCTILKKKLIIVSNDHHRIEYDFQNQDLINVSLYRLFFMLSHSKEKIIKTELFESAISNTGDNFKSKTFNIFELQKIKKLGNFVDEHTEILTFETYR